jgi:hypothetical protein
VKDPAVREAYLESATRWRRMAAQQDAMDDVLGDFRKREK